MGIYLALALVGHCVGVVLVLAQGSSGETEPAAWDDAKAATAATTEKRGREESSSCSGYRASLNVSY